MSRPRVLSPHTMQEAIDASDQIFERLNTYSREPFLQVLSDLLGCAPDIPVLQAFARENPKEWATAVKIFAELGGFHQKLEIQNNILVEVRNLSDAELLQRRQELAEKVIEIGQDSYSVIKTEKEVPPSSTDQ